MRVLIVHNFYQLPGGEDEIFLTETRLLRRFGHDVERYAVHNEQVESLGKLKLAAGTIWNFAAAREIEHRVRAHRAQVVHFHNTFPLLSPAVYSAARRAGAAVVQTLHNFRLICPAATLLRDGKPCEDCLGRLPLPAIAHGCYRGSRAASAVTTAMLGLHRAIGTFEHEVDAYTAATDFARDKFISAGLDGEKIRVKPNFVDPDPGAGSGDGGFALFAGRLSEEKGINVLLSAWERGAKAIPLKICGDGPLAGLVQTAAQRNPSIEWLGQRKLDEVLDLMGRARMLVFPSIWYEGFPRVIVESLARGTPVAASDLGSMREMIEPGHTGARFKVGDADELARTILELWNTAPGMRQSTREEFLAKYDAERNYRLIMEIYQQAIARRHGLQNAELVTAI
jgi:glycosyltransferase involved in cell wall biosynthesis